METETLKLNRLDRRRLGEFERLHQGREFTGCYCARWTGDPAWAERCLKTPKENYEAMRARILSGAHAGFLVHREMDGALVGWTAAGPKSEFPLLQSRPGSRSGPSDESVWAIACMAMAFPYRGLGYSGRTVELVIDAARAAGAKTLEAYPVEPEEESQAYRGNRKFYEALGFSVAETEADGQGQCLRMVRQLS